MSSVAHRVQLVAANRVDRVRWEHIFFIAQHHRTDLVFRRTTGATDLIAGWLHVAAGGLPPIAALGLMLVAAMAVTPFLNNAATVLVVAPIAAGLASRLGLNPDPFLMAVAVGAACDFLTPFGHQCNTLVMGPGGYRFSDYWKLGLPLSILIVLAGVPLIAAFWPLAPR